MGKTVETLRYRWRDIAKSAHDVFIRTPEPDLPKRDVARMRAEIAACIEGRGGDVSSRARAAALGRAYLSLNPKGRRQFLELVAEFVPNREAIASCNHKLAAAENEAEYQEAARALRDALESPPERLFRQFNSLPEGVKFLVDLRAELLTYRHADPALARIETDLRYLLTSWFDIGFLELQRITWNAPAALLEKLANYEAVHEVRNWLDLKNRLDADRRCYAFFHPLMPTEPLIFIEVALTGGLSSAIEPLLDPKAPVEDPHEAQTAVFYSISACQEGLSGISFGNALIKRVANDLLQEFRSLRTVATLSPIPGFVAWLERRGGDEEPLMSMLSRRSWHRDPEVALALKEPLLRLCAHYLCEEKRDGGIARDPVAHFHLSNGARMERINWLADRSARALRESAGMMVNYVYRIDQIDENHEAYCGQGEIAVSAPIKSLLH